MKIFNYFVAITFILSIVSCSSNSGNSEAENDANKKLGKLEIDIPENLKDNQEVCEYIKATNEAVDAYALTLDNLIENTAEIALKKEEFEELGMMDKITIIKALGEYTMATGEIMAKWTEAAEKRIDFEKNLSEDEVEALATVFVRFEERIKQIEQKYDKIYGDIDQNKNNNEE